MVATLLLRLVRRGASALLAMTLASTALAEGGVKSVDVRQAGDTFLVDAVMFAPVPAAVAWDVLTDFDHFDRFSPNVRSSKITKREGNRMVIHQTGVARFGALSIPYESDRQIDVSPPESIRSVQLAGSMKKLESLMTFKPEEGGTRLLYHLEMVPGLVARSAMSPGFVKHEIEEQFNALIDEMVKRTK